MKEAVLKIYSRPELSGVNFLHFKDILLADFGISLSYSANFQYTKNAGFESPKKQKNPSPYPPAETQTPSRAAHPD